MIVVSQALRRQRSVLSSKGGLSLRVLGINALYHDPAVALVIDGRLVSACEEERFRRRKHGKRPVPFAACELPVAVRC